MSWFQGLSAGNTGQPASEGPLGSGTTLAPVSGLYGPSIVFRRADERAGGRPPARAEGESECGKLSHLRIRTSVRSRFNWNFLPAEPRDLALLAEDPGAQNAELVADHHGQGHE